MQKRNSHHKNLKIFPAGLLRLAVFLHDGFHFPEPQGIVTINFKGGSSYGANHFQVLKPFRVSKKYFLKCSVISVITRKQISRITFVQLSQRILYSWTCKTILLCYSEQQRRVRKHEQRISPSDKLIRSFMIHVGYFPVSKQNSSF